MPNRLPDKIPQVSSRVHYLIVQGSIPLPAAAHAEIIEAKREIQATVRLVLRMYVKCLSQGYLESARDLLLIARGAQELRFEHLFAEHGYPDEVEPVEDSLEWFALAGCVSGEISLPKSVARTMAESRKRTHDESTEQDQASMESRFTGDDSKRVVWKFSDAELELWAKFEGLIKGSKAGGENSSL